MYEAVYKGEPVGAFEIPHQTDAHCPECGERVRVWREAENGTARHFKHISNIGGNDSGGGTACGGGESNEHRKWKNFAAERLQECFPEQNTTEVTVEKEFYPAHSDKESRAADGAIMFETFDRQLGKGLAIEVQHKNKNKDILETTLDYVKQDVAVAWLDESDFTKNGCRLNETDFRQRARDAVSIRIFGNPVPWWLHLKTHVEPKLGAVRNDRENLDGDNEFKPRQWKIPATIPLAAVDEIQYRESDWSAIFTGHAEDHFRMQAVAHRPASRLPKPTIPPVIRDALEYENSDWAALFDEYPECHFQLQAAIPHVDRGGRKATFQKTWCLPQTPAEYWHESDWHDRFPDLHNKTPENYIAEVGRSGKNKLVFGAILPPEFLSTYTRTEVEGIPDPPQTPHDDVQCHSCGNYDYAPSADMYCKNCGTLYDWRWNIETGRVSPNKTPEMVDL